jgi:hypothetical protein
MKASACLLILSCYACSLSHAQPAKDFRARIIPNGRIEKISVLENESLWLGTMVGELYYTNNFDQNWHRAIWDYSRDEITTMEPQLNTVVGFDNGIMLVTGHITEGSGYGPNAILRSTDRGKTWNTVSFTTKAKSLQVHAVDYNQKGQVWLSGGPARFFYSRDFGKTWNEFTSPYAPPMRVYGMDMTVGGHGYVSTQGGKISFTADNGTTWTPVPTPYDQKLFTPTEIHWTLLQVDKISVTGDYLVVRQGDGVYFTMLKQIQWRALRDSLVDFSVDRITQQLIGVSRKGKIIFYDRELNSLNQTDITPIPFVDITALNGKLYALDKIHKVYRISPGKVETVNLFTEDFPIQTPGVVQKGTAVKWGTEGRDIYNASFDSFKWYRVKTMNFSIVHFRLLNDNEAILWDGKTNYHYNRDRDSLSVFREMQPLSEFLAHKIDRIEITTTTHGCFHYQSTAVTYERNNNKFSITSIRKNTDNEAKQVQRGKEYDYEDIALPLAALSSNPSQSFTLRELNIDEALITATLSKLRQAWNEKESYNRKKKKPFDEQHFRQLIQRADTLSATTIRNILLRGQGGWSTTSNHLNIKLTNESGQTLTFSSVGFFDGAMPFFLPWAAGIDETNFTVTSLPLAQSINRLIPDWMLFKEEFTDEILLFVLIRAMDGF